jgi:serine/threonine protein kinase
MPLEIGQSIHHERYRIDSLLGQGGMGAVYQAWDTNLEIPVAIKENLDASPEAQKQFTREAQILARLAHPNLPRVIDSFIIPEVGQYLVMDYVEGEDLQTMLGRLGRLPEPQVLNWISQICDALAYLHNQSSPIIHRDIKPGNIKIRSDGRAMLVDFGIAKVYNPTIATTMGARAFTPGYSPPEQYGTGSTDRRSDIYALGATVYHLLTGNPPPDSLKRMVNRVEMLPPRELNNNISRAVEKMIIRSTELDTDHRYQSVEELLAALQQSEEEQDSHAKTEAVPSSSEASKKVEIPQPVTRAENEVPHFAPVESSDLGAGYPQVITIPKRRSKTWQYALGGGMLLLVTGLCAIYGVSKLIGVFGPSGANGPIRTTLYAIGVTPSTPTVYSAISGSATTNVTPTESPSSTPTQEPTTKPPDTPTPTAFSKPPQGYQPVAQVLPLEASQSVRGVAVNGDFLYLLTSGGILDVYDISGLSPSTELMTFRKPISSLQLDNGNGLLLNDTILYAFGRAGLDVVDVSDPSIPGYLKSITEQKIFNLSIYEDYLLAPGSGDLGVYDLSNPTFPRLVSLFEVGQEYNLYAAIGYQKYIYASGYSSSNPMASRNFILDFSDPTNLSQLAAYDHNNTAYHYFISDNLLVACADSYLEVWNLDIPEKPGLLSSEPAQSRACALDNGVIITNGSAAWLTPTGFKNLASFNADGRQPDGFPYGSAVRADYVFLAQQTRVLVLYRFFD